MSYQDPTDRGNWKQALLSGSLLVLFFLVQLNLNATPRNERLARELSFWSRHQLNNLEALSIPSLSAIAEQTQADKLEQLAQEIYELDNPAIGSRQYDEKGRAPIHHFILNFLEELEPYGVEVPGTLLAQVATPVELSMRQDPAMREPPAQIQCGDESWKVSPLWPNGAMPSLAPEKGIEGHLLYAGKAEWEDINGSDIPGSIAIMDFGGGRNWERLFMLGAKAVIIIDDNYVNMENADLLHTHTPYPLPRFYADKEVAVDLLERCSPKPATSTASGDALPGSKGTRKTVAKLTGGSIYENRPVETIFAWLPPTAPLKFRIEESTHLNLIASTYGFSIQELLDANELVSTELATGQKLSIPGTPREHTITAGELRRLICSLYAVTNDELMEANPGLDANTDLEVGTVLTIPNANVPLVMHLPIESLSIVPDAPHGAKMAANLAAALNMLEHLATADSIVRRRGLLMVFLDGDTHGGIASRTFAEYALTLQKRFSPSREEDAEWRIERYKNGLSWFSQTDQHSSSPAGLNRETELWLAEEWLLGRFEDVRIMLAEARIPHIVALNDTSLSEQEKRVHASALREAEEKLNFILKIKQDSLDRVYEQADKRLQSLFERITDPDTASRLAQYELDLSNLRKRYRSELEEEKLLLANHENNQQIVATINSLVNPGWESGSVNTALSWFLDLSDGSFSVGINTGKSGDTMRESPRANSEIPDIAKRLRSLTAFAATKGGWQEDYLFVDEQDNSERSIPSSKEVPLYDEFWQTADMLILPLGAKGDSFHKIDTPLDTIARFDFDNLSLQARTVLTILKIGLENPIDATITQELKKLEFSRVGGSTVQFNIRSGIDASDPVPGAYVYFPVHKKDGGYERINTNAHRGYRRGILRMTLLNGSYQMPVVNHRAHEKPSIFAYYLDRNLAVFTKAANEGQVGTKPQLSEFRFIKGTDVEKKIVLSDVYPLVIFPGNSPHNYNAMGGQKHNLNRIRIVDAVRDGEPRNYAVDNPSRDYREKDTSGAILYARPGRHLRAIVQPGVKILMVLPGPLDGGEKGQGHLVGPLPNGDRNLTIPFTPVVIATEMLEIAQYRQNLYRQFGITSRMIDTAITKAEQNLKKAKERQANRNWQEMEGNAREAWGILSKNYPRLLALGQEAVFSVILIMAFLVPAAYFLEKLVIGAKQITHKLAGTTAIFIAGTLFLNAFHPAFRITLSPFIVVIAFTMILMSTIVLIICYQRFEVILRRARIAGGEAESEEISLMSTLGTAFSLGVSNLKKRMSRTVLTTLTVTVLTFSIVSFVAVRGGDKLEKRPAALDDYLDGKTISPYEPAYEGVLFRQFQWQEMGELKLKALRTEFGGRFTCAARAHYIEMEGGNQSAREGINQISLRFKNKEHIVTGIMAFEPQEAELSGLNRAVSQGQWFTPVNNRSAEGGISGMGKRPDQSVPGRQQNYSEAKDQQTFSPSDRFSTIIPDTAAEALGITTDMLYDNKGSLLSEDKLPVVEMRDLEWRVIGILDTAEANRIRDVNGKSLSMVDYLQSGMNKSVGGHLVNEGESYHLNWTRLVLIPFDAYKDVDAKVRSFAIKFPDNFDANTLFSDLALRMEAGFFAHTGDETNYMAVRKKTNLGGVAKITLPVILCVLIVMNTMLGAVDERKGEVSMLGAVGLSPRQIAYLLLSEATVFSILGMVLGTFSGLLFANITTALNTHGIAFLSGLSFNFTSLLSMILATGTGLIVLLATLLPASRAATLAAPSGMSEWKLPEMDNTAKVAFTLPFTLTKGNAVGMVAFFRQFLENHTETTSSDFYCRDIRFRANHRENKLAPAADAEAGLPHTGSAPPEPVSGNQGEERLLNELVCSADIWLAPYDMDVAQHFALSIVPAERQGVFAVELQLERFSGTEESWRRTNQRFLNLVRHQFLIWRNMDHESRERHIHKGAECVRDAIKHAEAILA